MEAYQKIGQHAFTPSSIALLCNAVCLRPSSALITNVQLDSRLCSPGSLFFALKGEHGDGFSYIHDVDQRKAAAVVVPRTRAQEACNLCSCSVLAVDDVLSSLQMLARSYLSLFPQVKTIGITGSCGKSTTKEAISRIAGVLGPTAKTPGNLNSIYGLPLSLFSLDSKTRYGVFEMGIDHVGEMDQMVEILKPSVALLTNIGISHLAKMGSERTIAAQKARIFHPSLDVGFISRDCKQQKLIQKQAPLALQNYSLDDIQALDRGLDGWLVTYHKRQFAVRCVGRHLLEDVAGAIKVGEFLGASPDQIAQALEGFEPMQGRSFVHHSEVTIIDDSYNASLDSTTSILTYLSQLSWNGNKKVVLGPMKELGSQSRQAHRMVAKTLARSSFSKAYLYGMEMEDAWTVLKSMGYQGQVSYTKDFSELQDQVEHQAASGDLFLLKASRSVAMERLIPSIQRRPMRYA